MCSLQKKRQAAEKKPETTAEGGEKVSYHVKPYRRMLPGLSEKREKEEGEEDETEQDDHDDEEGRAIPTPRKRLMNFKIPIINRGSQRRDQNVSVVARRRLFSDEGQGMKGHNRRKTSVIVGVGSNSTHICTCIYE